MPTYVVNGNNEIEIDFHGTIPDPDTRARMKAVRIWWDPKRRIWHGPRNDQTAAVANEICGGRAAGESTPAVAAEAPARARAASRPARDFALRLRIRDIVSASRAQLEEWEARLRDHVNEVMGEDNSAHSGNAVGRSQESVWMDCFAFVASTLSALDPGKQEFELVFEYSLPGTVHERPDVLLLTGGKVISLEFKRKSAPQVDDNKDDVAQAIRYREWIENHHKVTRDRGLAVRSYLVCTSEGAAGGSLRGIRILTRSDFLEAVDAELDGQEECGFADEWLASPRTEMPDMLQAIEIMYREGRIPYISDVNERCLRKVLSYVDDARRGGGRCLILIDGVPGAGKTAVGQSVVYEENVDGNANAVYLSGNGPLVEVLQYQIDKVGSSGHMGENAIQGMKAFKRDYFSSASRPNGKVPEQSILVFDEAQRAWDEGKTKRGFSEPEGLFDVGERIFGERGYAVLIGLYGTGQVIYDGEETGIALWRDALERHPDWRVVASDAVSRDLRALGNRLVEDDDVFLPVSLRADFIDCSGWVEQAICREGSSPERARKELEALQGTSMRICVTRDASRVRARAAEMAMEHPEWRYGLLISNFAVQDVVRKALPGWDIGYKGANVVSNGSYGRWFDSECTRLDRACTVYGSQGLELDCPIVLFGGGYVRRGGRWATNGRTYERLRGRFQDADAIVENNFRVLLTRARREMILLIPDDRLLDETYDYFLGMGMDVL